MKKLGFFLRTLFSSSHARPPPPFPTLSSPVGAAPALGGKRVRWKIGNILVTVASVGGAVGWVASGEDRERRLKLLWAVPLRLTRDVLTAAFIVSDYQISLWGLEEGSPERALAKHEAHVRCANRLQALCFKNGGIYIKLGQHIGQLYYLLPEEYVQTMRNSLLDKCPVSTYEQVCSVFLAELGQLPHEVYKDFNPIPLASASLAQVHVAHTRDGNKVAVKVQHIHLTDTAAADTATVALIVSAVHWLFPSFDYRWLLDEIQESLPKELDFVHEAKNSELCMLNFKKQSPHLASYIAIPTVYWKLSTSRLLTMEYMEGTKITDPQQIRKLGLTPSDVAKLISQAFAEMIFRHGFVHCDPHAANMLVRVAPGKRGFWGWRKLPQLVLLDHGLYKTISPSVRTHYAGLWKALVFADAAKIKEHSLNLGAGEDLYVLFAGVLTMRPWNHIVNPAIDHLNMSDTEEERDELQTYASQYVYEVSTLLSRLPRVILLLLKTNDCLRSVDKALGTPVNTYVIIGREAARAVAEMQMSGVMPWRSQLLILLDRLEVELRLLGLQAMAWLVSFHRKLIRLSFLNPSPQTA